MTNLLYKESTYLNKAILSTTSGIREYDMVDAGFSIIKEYKLLPPDKIEELSMLPKKDKNIAIGKINGKNKELSLKFHASFKLMIQKFFEINKIEEDHVLSVKRDAVFLKSKIARHTKLTKHIHFKLKHKFTSYINLNGIECYYDSDKDVLTVKNIGGNVFKFNNGILLIIKEYMLIKEKIGKRKNSSVYVKLMTLRDDYVNRRLGNEYYREFNRDAVYRLNTFTYSMEDIDGFDLNEVDIAYNYMNVIVPLINIFI